MKREISGSVVRAFILCLSAGVVLFLTVQPLQRRAVVPLPLPPPSPELVIRRGYASYDAYLRRQLNKTLDPRLRSIWTTRDWDRKIVVFAGFFSRLRSEGLLSNASSCLCIGARMGQEVAALRRIGVHDAVGIDLAPRPPLVLRGDFHAQPFDDARFDFEFSNVFDHALYPDRFVAEVERTLRPGGVCVLHVAIDRRGDKYSANDLFTLRPLHRLFRHSDLVHVRKVDGFGLDTEIVFRKRNNNQETATATTYAAGN
ncbi:hypothetical protein H6P81_011663 [Aristolochia fimbriata]|uniref:Methyltransferase type 11 domain-containing protein n=1 Tax=Aristolochia fimbriata TaxID=158543 RepID=A0AAV7E9K3_ARIFI|nr:hypothetical protein H6P81_011663 [Aristolochia fimbriata]